MRTSVRSDGGLPSTGTRCLNSVMGDIDAQKASSITPSILGAVVIGTATAESAAPEGDAWEFFWPTSPRGLSRAAASNTTPPLLHIVVRNRPSLLSRCTKRPPPTQNPRCERRGANRPQDNAHRGGTKGSGTGSVGGRGAHHPYRGSPLRDRQRSLFAV